MSTPPNADFICFAHRGASGHEPENTLLSFRRALELGARWIELDVRVVEGEAIIFHDRTLARRARCGGVVEKQSLTYLRSLDVGKGERIPLLSEVLELVKGRAALQIELKGGGSASIVAAIISGCLIEGWLPESFLISSFEYKEIAEIKRLQPAIPVGLLPRGYPDNLVEVAHALGAVSVHLSIDSVIPTRIKELHAAGLKVFVYTVNDPVDLTALRAAGIDGVFTDFPERVIITGGSN